MLYLSFGSNNSSNITYGIHNFNTNDSVTSIIGQNDLSGNLIDYKILNTNVIIHEKFFINIKSSNNYEFMKELINRAEKVNNNHSTKKDFQRYIRCCRCSNSFTR
jgi:hypothetical protein